MDDGTIDTLLRFAVPIATFAFGTLISAQRNSASDTVAVLNELIADLRDLQNCGTEYWVHDTSHKDLKINEARVRGLNFSISAIVSQGLQLAPKDENNFVAVLDEIVDLSTGGDFEGHDRQADFARAVDVRNKCAELIFLARRERSRRNAPLALLIDPWRSYTRTRLARFIVTSFRRLSTWPKRVD